MGAGLRCRTHAEQENIQVMRHLQQAEQNTLALTIIVHSFPTFTDRT